MDKVHNDVREKLENQSIAIYDYNEVEEALKELKGAVLIDPAKVNARLYSLLTCEIKEKLNITTNLKAIKNEVEIANLENCHIKDGVAMVKFIKYLARAKFLKGTNGCNLDILARGPLWQEGLDYKCGTGHGIGFFLNVHEGPQGIRPNGNTITLEPGMLLTNEPGVYKEGKFGIRIENVMVVVKDESNDCGEFYKFETISSMF